MFFGKITYTPIYGYNPRGALIITGYKQDSKQVRFNKNHIDKKKKQKAKVEWSDAEKSAAFAMLFNQK